MVISAAADVAVEQRQIGVVCPFGFAVEIVVEDRAQAFRRQRPDLQCPRTGTFRSFTLDAAQAVQDAKT